MALDAFAHTTEDEEANVSWFASFEESLDGKPRTILATLHAEGQESSITVTIAGSFYWASGAHQPETREALAENIANSYALASLYDIARSHARALAGIVQLRDLDIPLLPPQAQVRPFTDAAQGLTSTNAVGQQ